VTSNNVETIIVGAGISGLACARQLHKYDKDFLIISKDIGGRILTSEDGNVNYGAFFVCNDYHHMLKYVTLKSKIKLKDFCFHENEKSYIFFEPKLIKYSPQFLIIIKILYRFRKSFRQFRRNSITISQKKAIENDIYLHNLYMQNALDYIKKNKLQSITETYLSKALYSTTFSPVKEMNALSFLQYLLPLITPIYTFKFEKEKMIKPFQDKIIEGIVTDINYKKRRYTIKSQEHIFNSSNIVIATQINWSKSFTDVKETNKPVSTKMLHIRGVPKKIISNKKYHLFSKPSNVQAIADSEDGTYLFYYKHEPPPISKFFINPQIIAHKYWDPAGTINGHILIESNRGNNMYLIGDYNVAGLEESYITGLHSANQIIKSL
jgi:hypothetical protein